MPQIGALLRKLIADGQVSDPASPRGKLLAAAAKLFRQNGYAATTVRDLGAEVGILSGSLFHHFKSKEEILFGVMSEVVVAMEAALRAALSEAHEPRAAVRALIATELAFIHGKTSNATAVLLYEWRALNSSRQAQILTGREAYFAMWQQTLKAAQQAGLVAVEPEYLRQLIHGALTWTAVWYKPSGALSLDGLADRCLLMALSERP